ncbi:MAG: hypothetical protein V3S83_12560 [Gemmatimonadota bacterium]
MELWDLVKVGGGAGATVLLYLRILAGRLDRIESKVDETNGSVQNHEVRISVLEDRDDG